MPRMNGLEFLNYCQHDASLSRIPIVMHTFQSSPHYRVLVENLGAAAYLAKPCRDDQLLAVIRRHFGASGCCISAVNDRDFIHQKP
jgi:chemotaxis family two-component system sensor histidine kinase/response regulator PixL